MIYPGGNTVLDASNCIFLGTAIQTGIGVAVIVRTGKETAFGEIAQRLAMRPPETEFWPWQRHFGLMITRVIMLLVLFVLLVNVILHGPLLESFLFSVAHAVGMTPEVMPMIITITLAHPVVAEDAAIQPVAARLALTCPAAFQGCLVFRCGVRAARRLALAFRKSESGQQC